MTETTRLLLIRHAKPRAQARGRYRTLDIGLSTRGALVAPDLYRAWMETPTRGHFPGGESYQQLRQRALIATAAIRSRHGSQATAIVGHGGVFRAILAHCLAMPDEAIFRLDQSYDSLSIIDRPDDNPFVSVVNAQPTMVAARRRASLPAFITSQQTTEVAP